MKNLTIPICFLLFAGVFFLSSCDDEKADSELFVIPHYEPHYSEADLAILNEKLNLPETPFGYSTDLPEHFGGGSTIIDASKATLGRVLFYDTRLSIDHSTSCASCHLQELAFADGKTFSEGVNNRLTDRNSFALGSFPSVQQYYGTTTSVSFGQARLFWDERAASLHEQMTETIQNPNEMDMPLDKMVERLEVEDFYQVLFRKAYGDSEVTTFKIMDAIGTFILSINSFDSKIDRTMNSMGVNPNVNDDFLGFGLSENLGKKVFLQNCGTCHKGSISPRFNPTGGITIANNGLDIEYDDQGVGAITGGNSADGKFKIPVLRNIEVTYPYMHDGRFETLEEVVEFYNSGVQAHPNLHNALKKNGAPKKLNLSQEEKDGLVAFLKTLTDEKLLTDEKFSDPFK